MPILIKIICHGFLISQNAEYYFVKNIFLIIVPNLLILLIGESIEGSETAVYISTS